MFKALLSFYMVSAESNKVCNCEGGSVQGSHGLSGDDEVSLCYADS